MNPKATQVTTHSRAEFGGNQQASPQSPQGTPEPVTISRKLTIKILAALHKGKRTANAMAEDCDRHPKTVRKQLSLLVKSKEIYRYGYLEDSICYYTPKEYQAILSATGHGVFPIDAAKTRIKQVLFGNCRYAKTTAEIATEINMDIPTVKQALLELVNQKRVSTELNDKRKAVYWLK